MEEKLMEFSKLTFRFGYNLNFSTPKQTIISLNKLMKDVEGKPEQNILEQMAIRTMSKAEYSTDNLGHYGLGFKFYTHFTSPIRRYPDLTVHRLIRKYLIEHSMDKKEQHKWEDKLPELAEHTSQRERRLRRRAWRR